MIALIFRNYKANGSHKRYNGTGGAVRGQMTLKADLSETRIKAQSAGPCLKAKHVHP